MTTRVLGIRHHGPGSARGVVAALDELRPDLVLVEGPPDADDVIPLAADPALVPPVALLVYRPDAPRRAVFYPFADFSPEWQAIRWALAHGVPARFCDLPMAHQLAAAEPREPCEPRDDDPLEELARAAGFSDGERFWEAMVEERRSRPDDDDGLFDAIAEAMAAARGRAGAHDLRREAWMRRTIRAAEKEGFARMAVVCGAFHAPALAAPADRRSDEALVRGLPRVKVAATWIPWSHGRLSLASGYGAGITSPGWYHELWVGGDRVAERWLTRVARLLRSKDLEAPAANVVDAVRLAEALAALRDRARPGLRELTEATDAVFCFGDERPLHLVHDELIVGETLGQVPEDMPKVPLAEDLGRSQRRLRLPPLAAEKIYDLDLRKPNDRERSHLLHRLALLDVPWGEPLEREGALGTFHEIWRLAWDPEYALAVVEAGMWGNTVADAAAARAADAAARAPDLPSLAPLLDQTLLADLPDAAATVVRRLEEQAALASDVVHLLEALPPLARVLRYGSVRKTDAEVVAAVVASMVTRAAIGLPGAAHGVDDDAAEALDRLVQAADAALGALDDAALVATWRGALARLDGAHGLLAGRAVRLLLDGGALDRAEAARRAGLALSAAEPPERAGAWAEGFLGGSAALLLHDETLWQVVDGWLAALDEAAFVQLLPLLRRTFARFSAPERRSLGERAGRAGSPAAPVAREGFDAARAAAVLPALAVLLGVDHD
ncbi:MAG TPA: DUF5682 family protein [Haliangiales bacterium]|nr:DUF5682 family protein [Haliangiales bacterium]